MSRRTPGPNRSCDSIQSNYLDLLQRFDGDNNGEIDIGELGDAGEAFSRGEITQDELEAIEFSFNAGCSFPPSSQPPDPPENKPPNAIFSISQQTGTAPFTSRFDASRSSDPDGSIRDYSWSFGGEDANGEVVTRRFTELDVGRVPVTLTVTDDDGEEDSEEKIVFVDPPENKPPNADFTISPQSGTAPFTVTLDGSASSDPDGAIRDYLWKLSTGGSKKGRQVSERFTESDAGTVDVTLTVTDNDGAKDSRQQSVTVRKSQNEPPEARASYSVQ